MPAGIRYDLMAVRAHADAAPRRGPLRGLLGRLGSRETTVESILDGLHSQGWLVVHGVETPEGRIDHIAVGPAGVFAVSTRAVAGRISVEKIDERSYTEPFALARRVEVAIGRKVTPVLVYSRARLSRPVSRQRGVVVVTAKTLAGHLLRRRTRLTRAEVNSLYLQVAGTRWGSAPAA
jgi:Nuclease-related domain